MTAVGHSVQALYGGDRRSKFDYHPRMSGCLGCCFRRFSWCRWCRAQKGEGQALTLAELHTRYDAVQYVDQRSRHIEFGRWDTMKSNYIQYIDEKPKDDDNFWSKILWSTVSNAALRSKNDKSATLPASIELMISVKTFETTLQTCFDVLVELEQFGLLQVRFVTDREFQH